jgi:hypothetical protein
MEPDSSEGDATTVATADGEAETAGAGGDDMAAAATTRTRTRKPRASRARKTATAAPTSRARAARGAKKGAKAERAPKPASERSAVAGVRSNPKNKVMFINSSDALALVRKALDSLTVSDLTDDERYHHERLIARIDARA